MKPDDTDRPNTHHWPPILYVVVVVVAWGLGQWVPLPSIFNSAYAKVVGWFLFAVGGAVGVIALVHFRRVGTPFDPTAAAEALAHDGIYRFTRNPMYLGALLGFVGLGVALNQMWLLLLQPVLAFALVKLAITREEAYLERRFGDGYRAYKGRVRRWL